MDIVVKGDIVALSQVSSDKDTNSSTKTFFYYNFSKYKQSTLLGLLSSQAVTPLTTPPPGPSIPVYKYIIARKLKVHLRKLLHFVKLPLNIFHAAQ